QISKRNLDKRQYGGASTFAAQGAGVDANAPIISVNEINYEKIEQSEMNNIIDEIIEENDN
ncbi:29401_t:CDS:2, partial [Gigaspora margarita]